MSSAMNIVSVLPPYLAESSIPTRDEILFVQRWVKTVTTNKNKNSLSFLDGWVSTSTPFSFQYNRQESSKLLIGWKLYKERKNPSKWKLIWTCQETGLRVIWQVRNFADYPALEWAIWLENTNTTHETALIENVQVLDLQLNHQQPGKHYIVHGANGGRSLPDDFLPFSHQLPSPDMIKCSEIQLGGEFLSSNRHLPFFNIETPEERGVIVGIGWTGSWLAKIGVDGTQLRVSVGLKETRFVLLPKEKIRTPRILLLFWKGARLHGHNMLRQVLYKYYIPQLQDKPHKPLVSFNTAFAYNGRGTFLENMTEEKILPLIDPLSKIGIELFIVDAGWYKTNGGAWYEWLGNWKPDPRKYQRGFRPISEILATKNILFGLWFEPEGVTHNASIAKCRPEWVRPRNDGRRGFSLRMELPEAREWFLRQVEHLIENEGIRCFRQDGNGSCDPDPTYRKGISEIKYIMGLYKLWDALREKYPSLIMEGCCGGGRRIDLETISRFHWHQKSDRWFDSESDQCGLYGANLYLPGGTILVFTDAIDDYGVWSSFAAQLCLAWNLTDEDFPMDLARRQIELYKSIRHLLSGDFYPLTPCSLEEPWIGYQFHRVDLDEGFALIFRRTTSRRAIYPTTNTFKLRLRGLNPQTRYFVHFKRTDYSEIFSGNLLVDGIEVTIDQIPGVEMLLYKKLSA